MAAEPSASRYQLEDQDLMGVGLYALHGLLSCGQFEISTQHVHLGAHLDVLAGAGDAVGEAQAAVRA